MSECEAARYNRLRFIRLLCHVVSISMKKLIDNGHVKESRKLVANTSHPLPVRVPAQMKPRLLCVVNDQVHFVSGIIFGAARTAVRRVRNTMVAAVKQLDGKYIGQRA